MDAELTSVTGGRDVRPERARERRGTRSGPPLAGPPLAGPPLAGSPVVGPLAVGSPQTGPSLASPPVVGRQDSAAVMTELFRAHHLDLVRLAVVMTGNLAAAEDVVQDVFERMHRRPPVLRSDAAGLAYARAAVLNGCRSDHRRNAVRRKHAATLAMPSGPGPDAHTAVVDRGALAAALRKLPGRQREVLVLRYYVDLDAGEIAAMLRIGPSAVRSAISRGLAALATIMGEDAR